MSSKNRIMTNFKSVQIFNLINCLAKKSKISKSRVIEEALRYAFDEQLKEPENLLGETRISKNRNLLPNEYFLSGLTLNLVALQDKRNYTVSPESIIIPISFSLPDSVFYNISSGGKKRTINRMAIRDKIKEHLKGNLDYFLNQFAMPDAIHFFLTESNISYKVGRDFIVNINGGLTVYILPVHINGKDMSKFQLLDFSRITYKRFSDVAKKGWNRSKYSHLLYIDDHSQSKSGGYFIGVLHEKKEFSLKDFEKFERKNILFNGIDKLCLLGYHLENSKLIIKRNQSKDE